VLRGDQKPHGDKKARSGKQARKKARR
jgi:hypothetical protein